MSSPQGNSQTVRAGLHEPTVLPVPPTLWAAWGMSHGDVLSPRSKNVESGRYLGWLLGKTLQGPD